MDRAPTFAAGRATGQFTARDPWGSRAAKRLTIAQEFGAEPMRTAVQAKAYIHQIQKKCPYASDRRFLAGEWLYKSSVLHKSEPVPDKNYLCGKTRHRPSCATNGALSAESCP